MAAVASATPSEHMPDDEGLAASRQQRMRRVRSAPVMSVTEQRNTMPSQRSVPAFELPLAQDDQPAFSPPHARDRGASTSPASVSTQNQVRPCPPFALWLCRSPPSPRQKRTFEKGGRRAALGGSSRRGENGDGTIRI